MISVRVFAWRRIAGNQPSDNMTFTLSNIGCYVSFRCVYQCFCWLLTVLALETSLFRGTESRQISQHNRTKILKKKKKKKATKYATGIFHEYCICQEIVPGCLHNWHITGWCTWQFYAEAGKKKVGFKARQCPFLQINTSCTSLILPFIRAHICKLNSQIFKANYQSEQSNIFI